MLFRKRKASAQFLNIPPQVITIWGPGGNNTAQFSLKLAQELAKHAHVLLVELPCLGIPRLSFATNILDRNNHVEAALTEFWYKGKISLDYLYKMGDSLALLPICAFANPDNPLTARVELDVLKKFPVHLINSARQKGYGVVILICQGQLTHPLTFFALKYAERIIMPVSDPSTLAYSSLNIKKLVYTFKFPLEKFTVVASKYSEIISEVMWLKDERQEVMSIKVTSEQVEEIVSSFVKKAS
ncbi:MAG TPA: hypothetical protein GX532_03670 [Clostridia bacterium]|nr:hypothetical protein [Clostridia bacterium]HHY06061.1 hypothetical protein [Clostridia bacterium]